MRDYPDASYVSKTVLFADVSGLAPSERGGQQINNEGDLSNNWLHQAPRGYSSIYIEGKKQTRD